MPRRLSLFVFALLLMSAASVAIAQPPRRPDDPRSGGRPTPQATVVTRVNVNVDTDVDVSPGQVMETAAENGEDDEENENEAGDGENGTSFKELIEAVLNQAGSGSSISVITDININVETSIRVKCQTAKPTGSGAKNADVRTDQQPAAASDGKTEKAPQKDGAPKKKRRGKRGQKPQETTAAAVQPEETHAHIALNKLKLGKTLEIGVTGQVKSDEKAAAIAGQINSRTQTALLGLAILGMMVPSEQESLSVVRQAIGSVKADAAGNELSISAAIPRETPAAVKNIVEAAIRQ